MRWSFPIGRLFGIRIEVHVTFLLMLVLAPMLMSGSGLTPLGSVGFALMIFSCVLLHELGHALAARMYGIGTRDITLMFIGGLARLERMPEKPWQEIVVALAGPAVNVVIAAVLFVVLLVPMQLPLNQVFDFGDLVSRLFAVNIIMVLFNLVPAFPMDGGRVLRAALALRMPFAKATRIASIVGQVFAVAFAIVALFVLKSPSLLFISLFVFMSAAEERAVVKTRNTLAGMSVSAAMVTEFATLDVKEDLQRAADLLLAGSQQDFPVLEDGRLLGMLSRTDLIRGLQQEGPEAPVGRMVRMGTQTVEVSMPLELALIRMRNAQQQAAPVLSREALVGLLTLENVGELMLVREAGQRRAGQV